MARSLALTALLLAAPAVAQDADSTTYGSPEAVVTVAYEAMQRPPGEPFDWARFESLFLPGALLIPNPEQTGGEFQVFSPRAFTEWVDGWYAENAPIGGPEDHGFAEEETGRTVRRYGDVAQVLSAYQKRLWDSDQVLARGVNSYQLVHHDGRWWIVSVVWDEDYAAGPVPADLASE